MLVSKNQKHEQIKISGKPFSTVSSLLGLNGAWTPCANLLLYALLRILKLLRLIDGASAPRPVALVQSYCSGKMCNLLLQPRFPIRLWTPCGNYQAGRFAFIIFHSAWNDFHCVWNYIPFKIIVQYFKGGAKNKVQKWRTLANSAPI